jgi:hypothetical protein
MNILITKEDWRNQWEGRREATSSSESGLHFGHYVAGIKSDYTSHFHALKSLLVLKRGVVLDRWSWGLSVMLGKILGCALITKLRSILLMEAGFKATNKLIYVNHMLAMARNHKLIPEEIHSEKNWLADNGTLTKVLFYEIFKQTHLLAGIAAVDADNCYDCIAHPIALLVFQSLGVPKSAVYSMLVTIQEMKFFLCTGFGDSKTYKSSNYGTKTQGLCQGNGAAPAGWTVTSIIMINAHKRKDHGVHLVCTLSNGTLHIIGFLFVDDTDLKHLNMNKVETAAEAHEELQKSISNWGKVLQATGGTLKPAKSFYHLFPFKWKPDGTWAYKDNDLNPDFDIVIPLDDGTLAPINHLPITSSAKTLYDMPNWQQ